MKKFQNIADQFNNGRLFFREISTEKGSIFEMSRDGGLSWFPCFESIYKMFFDEYSLKAK